MRRFLFACLCVLFVASFDVSYAQKKTNAWDGGNDWPIQETKAVDPATPYSYAGKEAENSAREQIKNLEKNAAKGRSSGRAIEGLKGLEKDMRTGASKLKTQDIESKGYYDSGAHLGVRFYASDVFPLRWTPIKTDCTSCQSLVNSYNQAAQNLMDVRYMIERIMRFQSRNKSYLTEKDFDLQYEASLKLQTLETFEKLSAQLIKLEKNEGFLRSTVSDLKAQIEICESRCKTGETTKPIGDLIDKDFRTYSLPYKWRGPYPAVCKKCTKIAASLNTLPQEAWDIISLIDTLELEKSNIEYQIETLTFGVNIAAAGNHNDIDHTASKKYKEYQKKISKKIDSLKNEIKEIDREIKRKLDKLSANEKKFKVDLAAYEKCIASCQPEKKEPKKTACFSPEDGMKAITIGPNNEVGSSAKFQKDMKGKAKGMAMGAVNNMLGGSGVSIGGGKSKKPKTEKDPTKGEWSTASAGDTKLKVRTGDTKDGFVVSTDIDGSPGDGTFHAQWIQGADGKIYMPIRYFIISLYRNWKLTVWWDYKRWRDGELVEHKHGEEVSFGSDLVGTWEFFQGVEMIENAIWSRLGFNTTKKGAQHIGAVFNLPPAALKGPCKVHLVTHISLPDKDPVVTQPVVIELDMKD